MPACVLGNVLGLRPGILPAVQRANRVDRAVGSSVGFVLEEQADVGQLAAGAAIDTTPFTPFRNGQDARQGPLHFGTPGIRSFSGHVREYTSLTQENQAGIQEMGQASQGWPGTADFLENSDWLSEYSRNDPLYRRKSRSKNPWYG
jgi:hypothetical protein